MFISVSPDPPSSSSSSYIECQECKIIILKNEYRYHLKTNLHKSNCLLKTDFENIYIIATAFKNRIVTYKLNVNERNEFVTPEMFLRINQNNILKLLELSLKKHTCLKVNFELYAYFLLPKSMNQELKSFNTKFEIIYNNTNLHELYSKTIDSFQKKISEFEHRDSGWTFVALSHLEINVNKYCPMKGGSFIDLPLIVKRSRSCINLKNEDEFCFFWSIVAALYPTKLNVCRISSYPHYSSVLNTSGIICPPSPNDIQQFEVNNPTISINIYGLDKKCNVTGPLYRSKSKKANHVNLLYIEKDDKGHYCYIKDILRLVRRQVTNHKGKIYFCDACLQFFSNETKYNCHNCSEVLTVLPEKNSLLKFKHYERKQKVNFVIYADFECLLLDHKDNDDSKNTQKFKIHHPSSFAYYICCSHDDKLNKYVSYRGPGCAEVFVKSLFEDCKLIHKVITSKKPMTPLTIDQELDYQNANICHICNQLLFGDKVRDHDHVTSLFRGAAHSHCNLMHRVCPFIPVVFHNLSGYDSHLFITELAKYEGPIKLIPKSKEKYLSITKVLYLNDSLKPIQIKFIDSFQFLSSSLDSLSKSLSDSDFEHLYHEFNEDMSQCKLLRKKGIYPYDYVDGWSKFDEETLPPKCCFYNSLKMEHITEDDYAHAKLIWKIFDIRTLGEYTDLYLKIDVFLLCDIFEKFRKTSLHYYSLDPVHYVTSPSLSWDAMLFYTGVELELIEDIEIYQMIEKGIRGGLAQCSHRYAKSNNKYLSNYDATKPSSYLIYLDCNNLYGYAMMKMFPISEFKFLTFDEILTFDMTNVDDESSYGFILEVNLKYPDYLHNYHADLPFAAEKMIPPGGKTKKLIANLYDKEHYVIHYIHLKECLKNGLILTKIHRILKFRQTNFLKKYIDLNTELRQKSSTAFEKDFFKLLNNAIFGKTIENKRKQVNVKLVTRWTDNDNKTNKHLEAEKLIAKPNLKNILIFNENFVAIQLNHEKIVLDRPIYIGFTVLEYAKQHLYQFHYSFIKNEYGNRAQLCYTDTDSLLYHIHTDDVFADLLKNISQFDTSNFTSDNPYNIPRVNVKVPGLFKSELGQDLITEFIGLRAKLYYVNTAEQQIKKAKGISKPVTKGLTLKDYKDTLCNKNVLRRKMNLIKSIKHVLYSQQIDKQVLDGNDDKRDILFNHINTLPWGHSDMSFYSKNLI